MRGLRELVAVLMCLAVNARDLSDLRNVSALAANSVGASEVVYQNARHENKESHGTVLRADEFERFAMGLKDVKDECCKQDLNATLWGIVREEKWAVAMYDASVKGAYGVESGMVYQFGHYDQCLEASSYTQFNPDQVPVMAKYCLAEVTLDGIKMQHLASRKFKPGNSTVAHWGTCVPASCSASDVVIFLQHFLQKSVTLDEKMCQVEMKFQVTKDMMIYAFVVMFFVALAIASTLYHIHQIYSNRNESKKPVRSTMDMALKSFSIIENLRKIGQSGSDHLGLNAINGIKAIAMLLILGGHALSFMYSGPVYNSEFMAENLKQIQNGFLTNSLLFVDIFLFLSGFLFCRILLIELERRRGKVNVLFLYIGRYIRLTPSYMAVIGFYMTWFVVVGNGPLWESGIGQEQERCQASWWLNILYINNYIGTDKLCMFQSWYLSVDSQLFVLAPAVIYLLNKSRKYGGQFLIFVLLVVVVVPFTITYVDKLDPTLLVYADEVQDFVSNPFYIESYIKTHMRATGYVLGLLAGYVVHLMQEKGTKIPKYLVRIFWVISVVVGLASMFSITVFYNRPYTVLESALYAALHKVGWSLSVGWLVIAVTTGHSVRLQRFLSHRIFAPISRLTYCAYLCNGIVELYHTRQIRSPQYMTRVDLFNKTLIHSTNTFILALFLCLLFESPIHALERIIFRAHKKHTTPQKRDSTTPSTSEEQIA